MILSILIILGIIQYYICWMTYINWFNSEITYCKMRDSYSFIGMIFLIYFVFIPIIPIYAICKATEKKYLKIKWQLNKK